MPRVLIAADKFKGSLTAAEVAAALTTGLRRTRPDVEVAVTPVADGGDGTLAAVASAGFELVPVTAAGPTGDEVATAYARRDEVAVVELADACGLGRLPRGRPAPMTASSRGAGEVIARALDAGCTRIVLGIGGSASTDGGAGLLRGLGARLLDRRGRPLAEGGAALSDLAVLDVVGVAASMTDVDIVVACDVDNPLTGPVGAAAIYGPQKGADADQVRRLDAALGHFADVVARMTRADLRDVPGAGAAGGVGFAAISVLGAALEPGIDMMLDLVGFHDQVATADLVVTGEGSLDEQTLRGKAPVGVARAARAAGVPVVAVCGVRRLGPSQLADAGIDDAYALTDIEPDVQRCLERPAPLLERLGAEIATRHLPRVRSGGHHGTTP